jgi:mannose-6-phosphate isomerase-like protein (cupin superfamily)
LTLRLDLPLAGFVATGGTRFACSRMNRDRDLHLARNTMPQLITAPRRVQAAGNKPKLVNEYVGRFAGESRLSIAHMCSPCGWVEPGQTPEFDEYTLVLTGMLRVKFKDGVIDVRAGQAVYTRSGEWIQYSTPGSEGAEYVAICLPAFCSDMVHRDPLTAETSHDPAIDVPGTVPETSCRESKVPAGAGS